MIDIKRAGQTVIISSLLALAAVAGLLWGSGVGRAAVTNIDTGLSGVWENPPVVSPGFATAHFTFDDSTRVLTYALTVSGLSPNQVTMPHIHRGAIGVNGPIIYTLSDKGFTQVSGQITLTDA
ncbi:MAG TPA: CHRD domain-containing protein, partial [Dehalococcoidia bacterium]